MFFYFFNISIYFLSIWYAITLFLIGLFGLIFYHYNFLLVLLNIELMLVGSSFYFIISSVFNGLFGLIYALILIALAAAESAIGLSLLVVLFGIQKNILVARLNFLCG